MDSGLSNPMFWVLYHLLLTCGEDRDCGFSLAWSTANTRTVPFVLNMPVTVADQHVRAAGLKPLYHELHSPGPSTIRWIASQSPLPRTQVSVGDTVTMDLRSGPLQ